MAEIEYDISYSLMYNHLKKKQIAFIKLQRTLLASEGKEFSSMPTMFSRHVCTEAKDEMNKRLPLDVNLVLQDHKELGPGQRLS